MKQKIGIVFSILIVFSASACMDWYVEPAITSCFSTEKITYEVGEEIVLLNCSNGALDFLWDFDDGTQSAAAEPIKVYEQAGTYTITLSTFGENNMEAVSELNITILPPTELSIKVFFNGTTQEVADCNLILYTTEHDWVDDANRIVEGTTDVNGVIIFTALQPINYYIYASKPDDSDTGHYSNWNLGNATNRLVRNTINYYNIFIQYETNKKRGGTYKIVRMEAVAKN